MASEKNLNAVFTDIANAIRVKKGTTDQIKPINMAEEIANLPSGGGSFPPDWAEIGYDETPPYILDDFEYAKKIANEWDDTKTTLRYSSKNDLYFFPKVDTSKITDMQYAFDSDSNLKYIPLLDTSNVTTMYMAFHGCSKLKKIPCFNTSKVTTMTYMFESCGS